MYRRTSVRMQSTLSKFPYASEQESKQYFEDQVASIKEWWASDRFKNVERTHSAEQVAKFRGTLHSVPESSVQADLLFNLIRTRFKERKPLHMLGVLDPVQMTQNVKHLEAVYVSGWASSSTNTTNLEVGPDFGDYPYDTVPRQVERIFRAQKFHDKKSWHEYVENGFAGSRTNYLRPIIADADSGHGNITSTMKMAKMFAECGAAAIHLEDQLHGGKKCGHLSGKIVVPSSVHVAKLAACRLQWDIMGANNLLIARTDSESATFLSSDVDKEDHAYIYGVCDRSVKPFAESMAEYRAQHPGATGTELSAFEESWFRAAKLVTLKEAISSHFAGKADVAALETQVAGMSIFEATQVLQQLSPEFYFNVHVPRTAEGHYWSTGGIDMAVGRALRFAPYVDMLWLETKTPDLAYARAFAERIHAQFPEMPLVYNLSPSFNWLNKGFTKADLKSFVWDLAKAGFTLQLVSLAGLHSTGLKSAQLASRFASDGMLAYVEEVQQQEKDENVDVFTHQKWSGVEYITDIVLAVQGSSVGNASKDSTEKDFK